MDKAVGLLCPCLIWRGHGCTCVLAVFLLYKNDRHGLCQKKKKKKNKKKEEDEDDDRDSQKERNVVLQQKRTLCHGGLWLW